MRREAQKTDGMMRQLPSDIVIVIKEGVNAQILNVPLPHLVDYQP